MEIRTFENQDSVASAVAGNVASLLRETDKSPFNLVLTGGGLGIKTVKAIGELGVDPERLRIIFCDERFVDSNSDDRNEAQAIRAWPDIEQAQFIRYPYPDGSTQQAAVDLSAKLSGVYGEISDKGAAFDLVLLGVGEDGHVASLFPGATHANSWVVAESNSPKPPSQRLSLSYAALNRSARIWFVVGGASKADAIAKIQQGEDLPAARVKGLQETVWWIDKALSDAL